MGLVDPCAQQRMTHVRVTGHWETQFVGYQLAGKGGAKHSGDYCAIERWLRGSKESVKW